MRLRKECEHGRWDAHGSLLGRVRNVEVYECPGGEFLPEGALVIEKVDGEWPEDLVDRVGDGFGWYFYMPSGLFNLLDALASQVGESE